LRVLEGVRTLYFFFLYFQHQEQAKGSNFLIHCKQKPNQETEPDDKQERTKALKSWMRWDWGWVERGEGGQWLGDEVCEDV
jgi:hypothetical protein